MPLGNRFDVLLGLPPPEASLHSFPQLIFPQRANDRFFFWSPHLTTPVNPNNKSKKRDKRWKTRDERQIDIGTMRRVHLREIFLSLSHVRKRAGQGREGPANTWKESPLRRTKNGNKQKKWGGGLNASNEVNGWGRVYTETKTEFIFPSRTSHANDKGRVG